MTEYKTLQRVDGRDAEIKTTDGDDIITVRQLCDSLVELGQRSAEQFLVKAERNEMFTNGDQYRDIDRRSFSIQDVPWNDDVPQVVHNLLRNLVLTWCQRLLQDRPAVIAYPNSSEDRDIQGAKAASALIEYIEFENNIDTKMFDILQMACAHGVGGMKCYYDPVLDEIKWDLVTIFDFYVDNVENPQESKWCVFKRYLDIHDAKSMLRSVGEDYDVQATTYQIGDLESREGVETYELWYRPDSRITAGIYALIVDGHVIESMDYPYVFPYLENPENGQTRSYLPLCMFKTGFLRGTVYGDTWMNDAVPIQRQINEIESVLVKLRRDTGAVKLIAPGTVVDTWDETNALIKCDDAAKAQMIRYMDPPRINGLLFEDRDRLEKRLYDVAGLNELLTGAEGAKSGTSAKQIAYISQLDNMKHAGTARHIEKFLLQLWRVTLHLVRKYYVYPRVVRIIGESNQIAGLYFAGTDIDGVDVRLEPRSGIERYSATKGENAIQRMQQKLEDPKEVAETSVTGLDETQAEGDLQVQILQQARMALEGYPTQPLTNINPAYASQVLLSYLKAMEGQLDEQSAMPLLQLKQGYDQLAATQAQQAQKAQAMQQKPGMQKPGPQQKMRAEQEEMAPGKPKQRM
jgi:hypothetical protein